MRMGGIGQIVNVRRVMRRKRGSRALVAGYGVEGVARVVGGFSFLRKSYQWANQNGQLLKQPSLLWLAGCGRVLWDGVARSVVW